MAGVTTNTMALTANNSYPTSVSVTTNVNPVVTATIAPPIEKAIIPVPIEIGLDENIWNILRPLGNDVFLSLPTESITISDGLTNVRNKTRTINESVTNTGSATRQTTKARSPSTESTTISAGTVARLKASTRTSSDSVSISSSVVNVRNKTRTINQSVSISESLGLSRVKYRSPATESVTISAGSVAKIKGINRSLATESITISESVTNIRNKIRTINQSVAISESLVRNKSAYRALATESVSISAGSVSRVVAKVRILSTETITISEAVDRQKGIIRSLTTETVTISAGSLTNRRDKTRALDTESISISESIARQLAKVRLLPTETVDISEALDVEASSGQRNVTRTITQSVSISEGLDRQVSKYRPIVETALSISENLQRQIAKSRVMDAIETISISESLLKQKSSNRILDLEVIPISDSVSNSRFREITRALDTETISIIETLNRVVNKIRNLPVQTVAITEHLDYLILPANPYLILPIASSINIPKVLTAYLKSQWESRDFQEPSSAQIKWGEYGMVGGSDDITLYVEEMITDPNPFNINYKTYKYVTIGRIHIFMRHLPSTDYGAVQDDPPTWLDNMRFYVEQIINSDANALVGEKIARIRLQPITPVTDKETTGGAAGRNFQTIYHLIMNVEALYSKTFLS